MVISKTLKDIQYQIKKKFSTEMLYSSVEKPPDSRGGDGGDIGTETGKR